MGRFTPLATWGAAIFGLAAAAGCVPAHQAREQAPAPTFDPLAFFAGRTEGDGVLKTVLRRPERTIVHGKGTVAKDGAIVLDQVVKRGQRPPTRRQWRLRADGPGHYAGTLTDAVGPVQGVVEGNTLRLHFVMKGGLDTEQWLYLEPGAIVAHNVMLVRKLGIQVARLNETITRVPASGEWSSHVKLAA